MLKGEKISNVEGKFKLNDDNDTEMTDAESLDLSLDAFSINESEGWRKNWSVVVNNTRYIGNKRPKGKLSFVATDKSKDDYVTESGTKKDRNRGVLL